MKRAWKIALAGILIAAAGMFFPAWAAEPIARTSYGASSVTWSPNVENEGFVLTVLGPERYHSQQAFKSGETPAFEAVDAKGNQLPDGSYSWELRAVPVVSKDVRERLNEARAADGRGDEVELELWRAGQIPREDLVLSGSFTISRGSIVPENLEEGKAQRRTGQKAGSTSGSGLTPTTAADQVIPDDLIVQQSLCVGFDCVNGESFGFDTIRLKENNTRIKFEDTSTGTFPSTDWQLTANDSASGGQNKFSIEDITSARVPFTIEGGSTTNSLYVDSTGRVGFRTSTPVLDIHIATSNTPGIRLEQNNSGGFTAQTWDIAGNEANFFVRDVTGGSRLPFRIRPGAPTSSVDISASGNVGIGTASPGNRFHVVCNGAGETCAKMENASATGFSGFEFSDENGNTRANIAHDNSADTFRFNAINNIPIVILTNSTERIRFPAPGGNVITAANGAFLSAGGTWTNSSSRTYKTDIVGLDANEAVETIKKLDPVKFKYKTEPGEQYVGFIAEDVPELVAMTDHKSLSPMDVVAVLTKVVQEQQKTIEELSTKVEELEKASNQQ